MRRTPLLRLVLVRLAFALPLGGTVGPRLLGLALGTWPSRLR